MGRTSSTQARQGSGINGLRGRAPGFEPLNWFRVGRMHPLAPYPVFSGRRFSFWASSNFFWAHPSCCPRITKHPKYYSVCQPTHYSFVLRTKPSYKYSVFAQIPLLLDHIIPPCRTVFTQVYTFRLCASLPASAQSARDARNSNPKMQSLNPIYNSSFSVPHKPSIQGRIETHTYLPI